MSVILVFFLLFSSAAAGHGLDVPISRISDDSLLRIKLKDSWLTETPGRVLARGGVSEFLETGERVEIRAFEGSEEILIAFSRELIGGRISEKGEITGQRGTRQFPGLAQGSWMLYRRKDTGEGTMIRVFLRSDQHTYIQFRPFTNEKSYMDAYIYGGFIVRSLPIAVPFDRLYTMRLNDVLNLAGEKFPRRFFEPNIAYYKDSRKFVSLVRENLSGLRFTDDGAVDENGSYVFIKTLQKQNDAAAGLNCSGFAKWLIDGILRPVTKQRLSIEKLKAPFGDRGSSFTDRWDDRDPYFGLDWIRNLASEANGTLSTSRDLEEFEVRNDNLSLVLVQQTVNGRRTMAINNYPGFFEEAGYGFEGLHALLYILAIDEPFKFYLAAVNNEIGAPITESNPRGAPRLRQYFHIAALVPYFDEYGVFRVVVFESAEETSFTGFRTRYPGHFVNLVQIPVAAEFDP